MSTLTAPSSRSAGPPPPVRTAPEARGAAVVAALALIAGLLIAPPWAGSSLPPGQVAELVSGALQVGDGGGWRSVPVGGFVPDGSRVRTPDEAAVLAVEDGSYQLARGTEARLRGDDVELDAGHVLIDVERVVTGRFRTVQAQGRGTWRFDVGVSPRVAVYDGGAGVTRQGTGREVVVAGLQQVDVIDEAPGEAAAPLRYLATDPWDARLLAEAIAIDRQAGQLAQGLRAQYGTAPRPRSFYEDFAAVDEVTADALSRAGVSGGESFGPPAEVLLTIVVIDLLARGAALPREAAVEEVVSLRQQGATYGLILRHHALDAQDLVDAFAVALVRRAEAVASDPVGPDGDPGTEPSPAPTGDPDPSPTPTPSPEPTPSPSPSPSPTDDDALDEVIDELPEPVREPVGELTDLVRDVLPVPIGGAVEELLDAPGGPLGGG